MTAAMPTPLSITHPAFKAWLTVAHAQRHLPTQREVRAALVYAAEQTAIDPTWLDEIRYEVIRGIVHIGVLPDLDRMFDRLVAAAAAGFGPMMANAVDALMDGGRS